MDCLFCKIIAGEIPSTKVYEDDRILAFRGECTRRIGDADITICVENTAGYLPFQQKAVLILLIF